MLLPLLLAISLASGQTTQDPPQTPVGISTAAVEDAPSPEQWLAEVDARAAQLTSLRYSATRSTTRPSAEGHQTTVEERWRFILQGNKFRIDYFGDTARQITSDGAVLLDYVPANGRAMRHHLARMSAEDQAKLVRGILERVSVPGFRVGVAEGVTWSTGALTRDQDRDVVELLGVSADGNSLRYVIDRERASVLVSEIFQGDKLVLRTTSSDQVEIIPGTWFPRQVELQVPERGGLATVSMRLTKVSGVGDIPPELFQPVLDSSVPIEEVP
ncbi:MAG: hypothetical protein JXX28_15665 [Deltaproteobacteria bacterium]|nr:hypothetical protein [Deltaproteobacteria bacterium]